MIRGWSVQKTRIVCIGPATTGRVGGGGKKEGKVVEEKEGRRLAGTAIQGPIYHI